MNGVCELSGHPLNYKFLFASLDKIENLVLLLSPRIMAPLSMANLAVEVKKGNMALTRPLKDRKKWFPDSNPIGIQVVDKRDVLQKHPGNTWIMSVERFLSFLI